jgi:hypothetical protein
LQPKQQLLNNFQEKRVTENLDEETELSSTLGSPRNPFFVQQMSFFFILKTVKS